MTSSPVSALAILSLGFAALPWLLPSVWGIGAGVVAHALWFWACEFLTVRSATRAAIRSTTAPTPAATPAPAKARSAAPQKPARAAASTGFIAAPVIAVFSETPSIKTIRVARPEGFEFQPGQFLTVRVRIDGRDHARCYSISSAPDIRGYLEISVRRQGVVSNALHATMRAGGSLAIKGPTGVFTYPAGDDRPLVLLAGGIGITPLMSMLRHAVTTAPTRPVTLLYSARTEDDFAFLDELRMLARRHPQMSVRLATHNSTAPEHHPGHIDEMLVRTAVPHVVDSICLICGPTPMIESMRHLLAVLHVPEAQVRHEVFNAAIAASSTREPESAALAAPTRPHVVEHSESESRAFSMACGKSGRSVRIQEGQTLLDAAEASDVPLLSLCRAGVCGTCRVQVTDGAVHCESDTLDKEDRERGFVLACVSTVDSDCTVQI